MEIKFKESGFCGSLEESYVASNGRLITEDYVKNLFTKKKMTDDELHDLLTWNTRRAQLSSLASPHSHTYSPPSAERRRPA